MSELSAALRQFADRLDAGGMLAGANQCAVVLASDTEVQATWMGHLTPDAHAKAGINLLAAGIAKFNAGEVVATKPAPAAAEPAKGDDSIFGASQ